MSINPCYHCDEETLTAYQERGYWYADYFGRSLIIVSDEQLHGCPPGTEVTVLILDDYSCRLLRVG